MLLSLGNHCYLRLVDQRRLECQVQWAYATLLRLPQQHLHHFDHQTRFWVNCVLIDLLFDRYGSDQIDQEYHSFDEEIRLSCHYCDLQIEAIRRHYYWLDYCLHSIEEIEGVSEREEPSLMQPKKQRAKEREREIKKENFNTRSQDKL